VAAGVDYPEMGRPILDISMHLGSMHLGSARAVAILDT
jgi:hypothetical protein